MKTKRLSVILLTLCVSIPATAFAEKIVLKSGQIIEGKVVEKTDAYVKVDFQGVPLTYFRDDIASIEGENTTGPVSSTATPATQESQIAEVPLPAVSLGNGPEALEQINKAYYNLHQQKFGKFECAVTMDVPDTVMNLLKGKYPSVEERNKVLSSLKFSLSFEKDGKLSINYTPVHIGDERIDVEIERSMVLIQDTLKSVFFTWGRFVIENPLLDPEKQFTVQKQENGCILSSDIPSHGLSIQIQLDSSLRITKWVTNYQGRIDEITPHIINSKQGLLLGSFEEIIGDTDNRLSATIGYQEVDGLLLPQRLGVTLNNTSTNEQQKFEMKFSDYKVEKVT